MWNSTEEWVEWCFDRVATGGGVQRIVLWVCGWLTVYVGFFFKCPWCADQRWVYCPELFPDIWKCPLPQLFGCLWWWGSGVSWTVIPVFYWHWFGDDCLRTILSEMSDCIVIVQSGLVVWEKCQNGCVIWIFEIWCGGRDAKAVVDVENVQERAQHTSLWDPGVGGEHRGCGWTHRNCLQSVSEEAVNQMGQKRGDAEVT